MKTTGFTLIEIAATLLLVAVLGVSLVISLLPMTEGLMQVRVNAHAAQKARLAMARISREFTTITNVASFGPTAIAYDYLVPAGATFAARRHVLSWSGSELRLQAADAGGALCDEVGLFALTRDDSHGADAPVFTVVLRLQNAMAGDLVSTTFSNRIVPRNMRAGSP